MEGRSVPRRAGTVNGAIDPSAAVPSELTLRRPRVGEEDEFLRAHRATSPQVPTFLHDYEEGMPFRRYLEVLAEREQGIGLPSPEHVPSTFLFVFAGAGIVGRASIRHRLTGPLERIGGHIGYVVVPRFRRQGHATAILRLSVSVTDGGIGSLATSAVPMLAEHPLDFRKLA